MTRAIACRALVGALLFVPGMAEAQTVTKTSVNVTLGGGYSNNPYGSSGRSNSGAGYGRALVAPRFQLQTERSQFTLDGSVEYRTYTRRFSDDDRYRVGLNYEGQPNERLKTHARIGYSDSLVGTFDRFNNGGITDPITAPDLGLFGATNRRRDIDGAAGLSYQISDKSSVSLDGFTSFVRYSSTTTANEFNDYGGSLSYSRAVSEHLNLGVIGGVSKTNYLRSLFDTTVYNGSLTAAWQLNDRWSINGKAGASRLDARVGPSRTAWTADVNVCYKSSGRSNLCARGARQFSPTGYSGTRVQLIGGLSYDYKISERDSITANGTYSRIQNSTVAGGDDWYWNGNLGYNRRQTERLTLSAQALYRKVRSAITSRADDYGGSISLTYRLGDIG